MCPPLFRLLLAYYDFHTKYIYLIANFTAFTKTQALQGIEKTPLKMGGGNFSISLPIVL